MPQTQIMEAINETLTNNVTGCPFLSSECPISADTIIKTLHSSGV